MRLRFFYEGRTNLIMKQKPRHIPAQDVGDPGHVRIFVWYNALEKPVPNFDLAFRIVPLVLTKQCGNTFDELETRQQHLTPPVCS